MADARYAIEMVLEARDRTGAAVQSALGNLNKFEERTRRTAQAVDEMAARFEKSFRKVNESTANLEQTQKKVAALGEAWDAYTRDTLEKSVKLEQASRRYEQTLAKLGATHKETALAMADMADAQRALSDAVERDNDLRQDGIRL